jgi:hypothetical protein
MVDATGCDAPVGHTVRYPRNPEGTTVTLSEYADAFVGIPQDADRIGKLLVVAAGSLGPPNVPIGLRVSTSRHGETGTKLSAD